MASPRLDGACVTEHTLPHRQILQRYDIESTGPKVERLNVPLAAPCTAPVNGCHRDQNRRVCQLFKVSKIPV